MTPTPLLDRFYDALKATGQEVHAMACNAFAIKGGRIKRYTVVNNTAAFLEACAMRPLASE